MIFSSANIYAKQLKNFFFDLFKCISALRFCNGFYDLIESQYLLLCIIKVRFKLFYLTLKNDLLLLKQNNLILKHRQMVTKYYVGYCKED